MLRCLFRLDLTTHCCPWAILIAISWQLEYIICDRGLSVWTHNKILSFISIRMNSSWNMFGTLLWIIINQIYIRPLVKIFATEVLFTYIDEILQPVRIFYTTSGCSAAASATLLLLRINDIKVSTCYNLGATSSYIRKNWSAYSFILAILICDSFCVSVVIIPMLSYSVNSTCSCIVLYKLLSPYFRPYWWINTVTKADEKYE